MSLKLLAAIVAVSLVFGCNRREINGVFLTPQHADLGNVTETSLVTREFSIFNMSREEITFVQVMPSCTCAKVTLNKDKLSPGEEANLKVTINPNSVFGKQRFSVTLLTDSLAFPRISCSLDGWFRPKELDKEIVLGIGNYWPDAPIELNVPIPIGEKGEISGIHASCIGCDLEVTPELPNEVKLSGRSPSTIGDFRVNLDVSVSGGDWGQSKVVLFGTTVSRWDYPTAVYLGFPSSEKPTQQLVQLQQSEARGNSLVRNASVSFDEPWVRCLSVKYDDKSIRIELEAVPGPDFVGPLDSLMDLEITFADATVEEIKIPVYARVLRESESG